MNEKIKDMLFDWWCSNRARDLQETGEATCSVGKYFGASAAGEVFIESQVMHAVSAAEKSAFLGGLDLGVGLTSGRLFEGNASSNMKMPL